MLEAQKTTSCRLRGQLGHIKVAWAEMSLHLQAFAYDRTEYGESVQVLNP